MANTTRQDILDNIKSTLEGVVGIRHVEIDRIQPADLESASFPMAFIYSDEEVRLETGVIGKETWRWNIALEIWTRGSTNLETLLGQIHSAMHSDFRRGGYALNSYRTGVDFMYTDPAQELRGMELTYTVEYDHDLGSM